MQLKDYYSDPPLLRRWHLIDGWPVCPLPAVEPWALSDLDVAGIIAENAVVRATVEIVEAYEAALRLSNREEPPETAFGVDPETGEATEIANPDHVGWQAAVDLVAATDPTIVELVKIRAGEPIGEGEGGDPIYAEPDPMPVDAFSDLTPVPHAVTARQARVALTQAGMMAEIDAHIAQLEPVEQEAINKATLWVRDSAFIKEAAAELDPPLPVEEINALFRFADQID
jgi:hypothetical protein